MSRAQNSAAIAALTGAAMLAAVAIVAPTLWSERAAALDVLNANQGPSLSNWLGTDTLGRDVFTRTLVATQLSIGLALAATAIRVVLGVAIGMWLSMAHRVVRNAGMRVVDAALSFPSILLAIVITTIVGPSIEGAVLGVGLAGVPTYARLGFTLSSSVVGRDYVAAAQALGLGRIAILWRHVLPNIADTLAISTATSLGLAIVEIASISFLGLGVNPPFFDWGRMLIEGSESIYVNPAAALGPALAIAIAGLVFSYLGEALALLIQPVTGRRLKGSTTAAIEPVGLAGLPCGATGAVPVMAAENLRVGFPDERGQTVDAVRHISLSIGKGEILGLVGESGSGKSLTAMALASLTSWPARVRANRLDFDGADLMGMRPGARDRLLGTGLAVVFQDPGTSLNPALRIREQMTEAVRHHRGLTDAEAGTLALEHLEQVRIVNPALRLSQYPHEFSGGMRQRVMIAMGLMMRPGLIIADEPTTALDVTVQAQILDLLREANDRDGTSVLIISHDLAVISQICHRVMVMYAGRIIESGPVEQVICNPVHPYTKALIAAIPDVETPRGGRLVEIPGQPPAVGEFPAGCAFQARCFRQTDRCGAAEPPLNEFGDGRMVACWNLDSNGGADVGSKAERAQ